MSKAEDLFAKRYFPDGDYIFWKLAHIDQVRIYDLWTLNGEEQRCGITIGLSDNAPPVTMFKNIPTHLHFQSSTLIVTAVTTWLNKNGRVIRMEEILRNGDAIVTYELRKGHRKSAK